MKTIFFGSKSFGSQLFGSQLFVGRPFGCKVGHKDSRRKFNNTQFNYKKLIALGLLLLTPLLLLSMQSRAVVVDHGAFLRDTDSGIDYLKLEHTLGISFDDATAAGAVFAGEGGWTDLVRYDQYHSSLSVSDRLALLGADAAVRVIVGDSATGAVIGQGDFVEFAWLGQTDYSLILLGDSIGRSATDPSVGVLLARPVPLPAAGWLLLSAIAGLLCQKRAQKRSAAARG